jgi:hypothetical protein
MSRARTDRSAQLVLQWVNLLLALIVLSIGLVVVAAAPAEAEQFATLHPLAGTVEVAADGAEFKDGREGQVLSAGDTIRTGGDGRAEIEYFDESLTRLDFNTTFTLEELSSDPDVPGSKTIVTEQEQGRTFERVVAITDSESRFETETPTATASVLGTDYVLFEAPDGTLTLWVLPDEEDEEGEVVLVLADGTEIVVREGEGVVVFPDGTAGEPFPLTDEHLLDPWVLFNNCDLDELDLPACQEPEEPPLDPIDPVDPDEPGDPDDGTPNPTPPAPSSFSSGGTTTTTTTGGGGGGGEDGPEDTTPPKTTITEAPPKLTRSRDATFRFRANEPISFFQCSLDGGSYNRCSPGRTYAGLGDGTHQFRVRATDTSGNRENTATHQWTIDTDPPEAEITGDNCSDDCDPDNFEVTFDSNEAGSTFECRLVETGGGGERSVGGGGGGGFEPCTSPVAYDDLNCFSNYEFFVRATDPAGNTGPEDSNTYFMFGDSCASLRQADREAVDQSGETGAIGVAPVAGDDDVLGTVGETVSEVVEGVEDAVEDTEDALDLGELLGETLPKRRDLAVR